MCVCVCVCVCFFRLVRLVNEKVTKKGVKLRDERCRVWDIKQILYADDAALTAES